MSKEPESGQKTKTRRRWNRWRRSLRFLYLRLLRLKGKPHEVAGGVAIGVFIGMTPTVPLHTVLAVLLALLLRKSKLAAALGVWVANPFFLPFIYLLNYKVGQVLTGSDFPSLAMADFSLPGLVQLGWEISYPLLFGGMITGLLCAIPSYFVAKRIILLYQARRRRLKENP